MMEFPARIAKREGPGMLCMDFTGTHGIERIREPKGKYSLLQHDITSQTLC